jgi:hypothetical protein
MADPITKNIQILEWVAFGSHGTAVLLPLLYLKFVRDVKNRVSVTRIALLISLANLAMLVSCFLKVFRGDQYTREDASVITQGHIVAEIIAAPLAATVVAIYLCHSYTWKVAMFLLPAAYNIVRLLGMRSSEIHVQWFMYALSVVLMLAYAAITVLRANRSTSTIAIVAFVQSISGLLFIIFVPLGHAYTGKVTLFIELLVYHIANLFAKIIWPVFAMALFRRPVGAIALSPVAAFSSLWRKYKHALDRTRRAAGADPDRDTSGSVCEDGGVCDEEMDFDPAAYDEEDEVEESRFRSRSSKRSSRMSETTLLTDEVSRM